MATIPVLLEQPDSPQAGTLGVLNPSTHVQELDLTTMRQSLAQLTGQVSALLQDIKSVGDFQLKEVTLQVAVTAEGGVALIGLAKAGVTGTMALKFAV